MSEITEAQNTSEKLEESKPTIKVCCGENRPILSTLSPTTTYTEFVTSSGHHEVKQQTKINSCLRDVEAISRTQGSSSINEKDINKASASVNALSINGDNVVAVPSGGNNQPSNQHDIMQLDNNIQPERKIHCQHQQPHNHQNMFISTYVNEAKTVQCLRCELLEASPSSSVEILHGVASSSPGKEQQLPQSPERGENDDGDVGSDVELLQLQTAERRQRQSTECEACAKSVPLQIVGDLNFPASASTEFQQLFTLSPCLVNGRQDRLSLPLLENSISTPTLPIPLNSLSIDEKITNNDEDIEIHREQNEQDSLIECVSVFGEKSRSITRQNVGDNRAAAASGTVKSERKDSDDDVNLLSETKFGKFSAAATNGSYSKRKTQIAVAQICKLKIKSTANGKFGENFSSGKYNLCCVKALRKFLNSERDLVVNFGAGDGECGDDLLNSYYDELDFHSLNSENISHNGLTNENSSELSNLNGQDPKNLGNFINENPTRKNSIDSLKGKAKSEICGIVLNNNSIIKKYTENPPESLKKLCNNRENSKSFSSTDGKSIVNDPILDFKENQLALATEQEERNNSESDINKDNSTLSENDIKSINSCDDDGDGLFKASNRLKRLEEHFKELAFKKNNSPTASRNSFKSEQDCHIGDDTGDSESLDGRENKQTEHTLKTKLDNNSKRKNFFEQEKFLESPEGIVVPSKCAAAIPSPPSNDTRELRLNRATHTSSENSPSCSQHRKLLLSSAELLKKDDCQCIGAPVHTIDSSTTDSCTYKPNDEDCSVLPPATRSSCKDDLAIIDRCARNTLTYPNSTVNHSCFHNESNNQNIDKKANAKRSVNFSVSNEHCLTKGTKYYNQTSDKPSASLYCQGEEVYSRQIPPPPYYSPPPPPSTLPGKRPLQVVSSSSSKTYYKSDQESDENDSEVKNLLKRPTTFCELFEQNNEQTSTAKIHETSQRHVTFVNSTCGKKFLVFLSSQHYPRICDSNRCKEFFPDASNNRSLKQTDVSHSEKLSPTINAGEHLAINNNTNKSSPFSNDFTVTSAGELTSSQRHNTKTSCGDGDDNNLLLIHNDRIQKLLTERNIKQHNTRTSLSSSQHQEPPEISQYLLSSPYILPSSSSLSLSEFDPARYINTCHYYSIPPSDCYDELLDTQLNSIETRDSSCSCCSNSSSECDSDNNNNSRNNNNNIEKPIHNCEFSKGCECFLTKEEGKSEGAFAVPCYRPPPPLPPLPSLLHQLTTEPPKLMPKPEQKPQEKKQQTQDNSSSTKQAKSTSPVNPLTANGKAVKMRELNGPLRGLLKKPNRNQQTRRKNRVVFDETRNEFFEADYIILIREDCAYDEEDEEPCTCGEHELVRLCCDEGCQCNYPNDDATSTPTAKANSSSTATSRTPQSPKYAPPIEFVDEAALSPPDGYKDNGLKNALQGALSGHVFGAQHIQQLQVIQRLQAQRAAMLAARASSQQQQPQTKQGQQHQQQQPVKAGADGILGSGNAAASPVDDGQTTVCTECAECVECASKQALEEECTIVNCPDDVTQLAVPQIALVPIHNSSPERRKTVKEIIAGEERPKYLLPAQLHQDQPQDEGMEKILSARKNQRYVVETITMTTVTERRIVREATEDLTMLQTRTTTKTHAPLTGAGSSDSSSNITGGDSRHGTIERKFGKADSIPAQITGILKGGKLWKNEQSSDETNNSSTEDDSSSKRSVRFVTENSEDALNAEKREGCDGQSDNAENEGQINELVPFKKHSTLFHNALRPNSAVRQLFPSTAHPSAPAAPLTSESLKAFDEAKRGNLVTNILTNTSDTDTIRRTIERNALRRSLIKYDIKKKTVKPDISLEERIKQLTCDIDEPSDQYSNESGSESTQTGDIKDLEQRNSPAGEESSAQLKYIPDKSFSPSSSASSSSSGSTSAYRKISDIFNRERRHEKIPESEENPIVIIPQECRCPAAPDLGMGVQVPAAHTQIHQTPPRQTEPRRQFLSTLAPLTACVAGQKDDLSYYTLAAGDRNSTASTHCSDYSLGDIEAALFNAETRKVAPDVIAGTPGQEQDELAAFAQQEANRTEKIRKRYGSESQSIGSVPHSAASSDDDEQNDYGFNKRPSVRGIKPKFSTTNEILQQMQAQLSQPITSQNPNKSPYGTLTKAGSLTNKSTLQLQPQQQQQQQLIPVQQPQPQNATPAAALQQHQTERTWKFYTTESGEQRVAAEQIQQQSANYYQGIPAAFRHTFHGHEESALMYQNCQSVSMEHYGTYARSPTRRPESPPPLKNYHQTMVLIPYNTESYAQFSATNEQQAGQFRRHNVVEYQQVTQQTIRVPIGYALPGMQLHVVAGRGNNPVAAAAAAHQAHFAHHQQQHPRLMGPVNSYGFQHDPAAVSAIKYGDRGVPEGAAAVSHASDCKAVTSPTSAPHQQQQHQQQHQKQHQQQQQQQHQPQQNFNPQHTAGVNTGGGAAVLYAMNV